jgi:hypothetical protein
MSESRPLFIPPRQLPVDVIKQERTDGFVEVCEQKATLMFAVKAADHHLKEGFQKPH